MWTLAISAKVNDDEICPLFDLQFQSQKKEEQFDLVKEDVLITWKEEVGFPKDFLRLLPIWASVRIIIERDSATEAES